MSWKLLNGLGIINVFHTHRWMTLHSILFMVPWPLWVLTANLVSGTRMLEPNWRRLKDLISLWLPAVSTPKEMCSVMQPAMIGQRLVLPSIKIAIFCQLKISTGGFLFFNFFLKSLYVNIYHLINPRKSFWFVFQLAIFRAMKASTQTKSHIYSWDLALMSLNQAWKRHSVSKNLPKVLVHNLDNKPRKTTRNVWNIDEVH